MRLSINGGPSRGLSGDIGALTTDADETDTSVVINKVTTANNLVISLGLGCNSPLRAMLFL